MTVDMATYYYILLLNYPLLERGFSRTMKQTGRNKYFKYNITWLRIPPGRRRTSWLFTNEAEELNLGLPRNNSRYWSERDLNPGPPDFKSGALTTRPRCLPKGSINIKMNSSRVKLSTTGTLLYVHFPEIATHGYEQ